MSALKNQILEATKNAMRQGDKERLGTLRMVTAAIKQREVDERIVLDDVQILSILDKMVKERRDAIEQFQAGNRPDLVAKEEFEISVIISFLPTPLTEAEIDQLIVEAFVEAGGAQDMKAMGAIMALLKPKIQGRADAGKVSAKVKAKLST